MAIDADLIKKYMKEKYALIIDANRSFSTGISKVLVELGMELRNVSFATNMKEAENGIERKPNVVISEYMLEGECTMELVEAHRKKISNRTKRTFIMTSANGSDSTVANIAEGDVDDFLLKPFSNGQLKDSILKILEGKIRPSTYMNAIELARILLDNGEFADAEKAFLEAAEEDMAPSLAMFFAGSAAEAQGKFDRALDHYRCGQQFDKKHYKCAYGQFGVYFARKDYDQAYKVIQELSEHYPVTPQRLGEVFMLSVFTKNIDELERLFETYRDFEHRPEKLETIVKAGFYAAGRLEIVKNEIGKSIEFFKSGIQAAKKNLDYVDRILQRLVEADSSNEALNILKSIPETADNKKKMAQMEFFVNLPSLSPEQVIELGQKMANDGVANEFVYEEIIQCCVALNKEMLAENFISKARKEYPELEEELRKLLNAA